MEGICSIMIDIQMPINKHKSQKDRNQYSYVPDLCLVGYNCCRTICSLLYKFRKYMS